MASDRSKAAKKAAKTRAANASMEKRWREIEWPAKRRVDALFNRLLPAVETIKLRYDPPDSWPRKLKNDAFYGELIRVKDGGRTWLVLPETYKRPQWFHAIYWEPLFEERV